MRRLLMTLCVAMAAAGCAFFQILAPPLTAAGACHPDGAVAGPLVTIPHHRSKTS